MVTLPKQFVATRHPGYFFNKDDEHLYSLKMDGVLKPLKFHKPDYFNKLNHHPRRLTEGGWRVSVKGQRRWLLLEELKAIVPSNTTIPVKEVV